jgi:hypothetical protein
MRFMHIRLKGHSDLEYRQLIATYTLWKGGGVAASISKFAL